MNISQRFSEIYKLDGYQFQVIGCGAIGSHLVEQLAKSSAPEIVLYDDDEVGVENVGVQNFVTDDIGKKKVIATKEKIHAIHPMAKVTVFDKRFESDPYAKSLQEKSIVCMGVDSMESRKNIAETLLANPPLFTIDGRMGSEQFQAYMFTKNTLQKYFDTWYTDEEGDSEPCSRKGTPYCADMAASFMMNQVRKFVTNQPRESELLFNFPAMALETKMYK